MNTEKKRPGRPAKAIKRVPIHTTISASTLEKLTTDARPDESMGQTLDRWASERK